MGVTSLEFCPGPEWCPFGLVEWSGPSGCDWWARVFTWGFFLLPPFSLLPPSLPPSPPTHPPCNAGLKLMHISEQVATSKVDCILFNRLLSPVLLNKSGLARAKAVNFNSIFKTIKCFSMAGFRRDGHIFSYAAVNMESHAT